MAIFQSTANKRRKKGLPVTEVIRPDPSKERANNRSDVSVKRAEDILPTTTEAEAEQIRRRQVEGATASQAGLGMSKEQQDALINIEKMSAINRKFNAGEKLTLNEQQDLIRSQGQPTQAQPTLTQAEQISQATPPDTRSNFEKLFFPTAQEGANRRLETFGTTSKIPAIITAIGAGALGAVGGSAIAGGLATAGATGAVGATAGATAPVVTSTTSLIAGGTASKLFLGSALLYLAGKGTGELKGNAKDADTALIRTMSGATDTIKEVESGVQTIEDGEVALEYANESIRELERAIKIYSSIPFTNTRKYSSAIYNAKKNLESLRRRLDTAKQLNDIATSRSIQ